VGGPVITAALTQPFQALSCRKVLEMVVCHGRLGGLAAAKNWIEDKKMDK